VLGEAVCLAERLIVNGGQDEGVTGRWVGMTATVGRQGLPSLHKVFRTVGARLDHTVSLMLQTSSVFAVRAGVPSKP